jgi:hypothetical protein
MLFHLSSQRLFPKSASRRKFTEPQLFVLLKDLPGGAWGVLETYRGLPCFPPTPFLTLFPSLTSYPTPSITEIALIFLRKKNQVRRNTTFHDQAMQASPV